jgi:hypothetical protein
MGLRRRMNDVFLDTGFVVALSSQRDQHHRRARERAQQVSDERTQIVTTRDVLVEIGNALTAVGRRELAVRYIRSVEGDAAFVVMRERGIWDALTADRDFEQAGFNALLRE